ncbi:MAG: cell division protein FtsA [Alistipes sp.]|nr:cell division protein FtsA [Alistipes sp.]
MKGKQIVAIDVGTSNVVIAVGAVEDDGRVEIMGIVSEPLEGVNAGRVENNEMVGAAVKSAKERIEQRLGIKITEAYAGLAGDFIRCVQVNDHVYVQDELGNGCNQITERDLEDLDRRMRSVKLPDDREEIITIEPLRYKVDEKEVAVPVGAYGHVLAATYNFILTDRTMRERLRQCLLRQGIKVKEFVPNTLISHLSVATSEDIEEGAIIIDLGGGLTDVSVLMDGKVRYIASIPLGVNALNDDIRAYGIPANYVENLKVKYGSALTEATVDDKIIFSTARHGTPKNILRRNLAAIIEARLTEIAEWVRNEIKDARCGSRFNPIVLLTGGGAAMPNIEKLFARELEIDDVRSVFPEYGFTETMAEHITTSAYATVASLLIYGAKRGSCAVAERPTFAGHTPETHTAPTRQTTTPEREPQRPHNEEAAHETIKPIDPETSSMEEIEVEGGNQGGGFFGWMKDKFEKMGSAFAGNDDEQEI